MQIDQTEFIQKVLPSIENCSWFLGAGTSASANLPTATDIIWDLKTQYYCIQEKQDIKNQDVQILQIRNKIQEYISSKGFPAEYDEDEYSFYFDLMFKNNIEAQRQYLVKALSSENIALSIGHRALAALMSERIAKVVFTTNFDKVIENAHSSVCGRDLSSYHLEGANACTPAYNNNEFPLYAKIHGDFQYQRLSNLKEDLLKADEEIRRCFMAAATRFGIIVAGYSGRDKCVMELFNEALNVPNAFSHGLYWTVLKNSKIHPRVTELISAARGKGIDAYIVEIDSFDSIMGQLWKSLPQRSQSLDDKVLRSIEKKVIIPMPKQSNSGEIIRFNILPVKDLPTQCFKIESNTSLTWADIKEIQKDSFGKAISWIDGDICAWGQRGDIGNLFPKDSRISLKDLSEDIANLKDHKALQSALEELICKSLTRNELLIHRKNVILVSDKHFQSTKLQNLRECVGQVGGLLPDTSIVNRDGERKTVKPTWCWSVELTLKQFNDEYFIVLSPNIWISPRVVREEFKEFLDGKRQVLKNDRMDKLLSAWIEILLKEVGAKGTISIPISLPVGDKKVAIKTVTRTAYSRRAV